MKGSPSDVYLVALMISRLDYEPLSHLRASKRAEEFGTPLGYWLGWDEKSVRLAEIVDMLFMNTRASAQRKAKYEQIAPRPWDHRDEPTNQPENNGPKKVTISLRGGVGALPKSDPVAEAFHQ